MRTRLLLFVAALLMTFGVAAAQDAPVPATFNNPLTAFSGADPWLTYYEGNYYLATTTGGSNWIMRRSPTLAGLKTAMQIQIYFETDPSRCCNFWAPEFRLLDGPDGLRWYFYYSAGTSDTLDNQRSYVLESAGTDPLGPYTFKGRLFDATHDVWSIDGSVLQLDDKLYFLFSSWTGPFQALYIAPMSNPWTISGARVEISHSEYAWEKVGLNVNEGPVALQHDGKTFIIYSASYCNTPDYQLGMLTYTGGDPLSADSWVKNPEPVFVRSDANGVYGPGHNGFFKSPDGTEDWIVYHANDSAIEGCGNSRMTRAQKFTWNADGTPNFGVPVADSEAIPLPSGDTGVDPMPDVTAIDLIRYRAFAYEDAYLYHDSNFVKLGFFNGAVENSQFIVVEGLADPAAVSLQSVNMPGYYLRHEGNVMVMSADDGSESFAGDATWWVRPGWAESSALSFESFNQAAQYIGQTFGVLALTPITDKSPKRAHEDATFIEERNR